MAAEKDFFTSYNLPPVSSTGILGCGSSGMSDVGKKDDSQKAPWHLLPMDAVGELVKVLEMGARKYSANSWQNLPDARDRYYSALMRHLAAMRCGHMVDHESGLPHSAHAAVNALFLVWFDINFAKDHGNGTVACAPNSAATDMSPGVGCC